MSTKATCVVCCEGDPVGWFRWCDACRTSFDQYKRVKGLPDDPSIFAGMAWAARRARFFERRREREARSTSGLASAVSFSRAMNREDDE